MENSQFLILNKAKRDFIIYGPASVEIVDKENDLIDMGAFEDALPQLLRRKALTLAHTDTIVGEVLKEYSVNGDMYETGVDGNNFYVVGRIREDTKKSQETREQILEGDLNAYSISGEALMQKEICDGEICYNHITKIDLSAVTICAEGMNQGAKFEVIAKQEKLEKKVRRVGDKWCVVHCGGEDDGKPIKGGCHDTKEEADKHHRAIMANKSDKMKNKNKQEREEEPQRLRDIIGGLLYDSENFEDLSEDEKDEIHELVTTFGETLDEEEKADDKKPPKEWWDRCISRVSGKRGIDDPNALCAWVWYHHKGKIMKEAEEDLDLWKERHEEFKKDFELYLKNCPECKSIFKDLCSKGLTKQEAILIMNSRIKNKIDELEKIKMKKDKKTKQEDEEEKPTPPVDEEEEKPEEEEKQLFSPEQVEAIKEIVRAALAEGVEKEEVEPEADMMETAQETANEEEKPKPNIDNIPKPTGEETPVEEKSTKKEDKELKKATEILEKRGYAISPLARKPQTGSESLFVRNETELRKATQSDMDALAKMDKVDLERMLDKKAPKRRSPIF